MSISFEPMIVPRLEIGAYLRIIEGRIAGIIQNFNVLKVKVERSPSPSKASAFFFESPHRLRK